MERRLAIAAAAAACHLAIVALGALRADFPAAGALGRASKLYATLSGAGSARGFFGSEVTPTPRATFEVRTREGEVRSAALSPSAGRDAEMRLGSALAAKMAEDGEACREIAAVCAGRILARNPDAESVIVKLRTDALPTMEEARRGAGATAMVLYEARFSPRGAEP